MLAREEALAQRIQAAEDDDESIRDLQEKVEHARKQLRDLEAQQEENQLEMGRLMSLGQPYDEATFLASRDYDRPRGADVVMFQGIPEGEEGGGTGSVVSNSADEEPETVPPSQPPDPADGRRGNAAPAGGPASSTDVIICPAVEVLPAAVEPLLPQPAMIEPNIPSVVQLPSPASPGHEPEQFQIGTPPGGMSAPALEAPAEVLQDLRGPEPAPEAPGSLPPEAAEDEEQSPARPRGRHVTRRPHRRLGRKSTPPPQPPAGPPPGSAGSAG